MTIHVRASLRARDKDEHGDVIFAEDSTLHISIVGRTDLLKLQELFNRALNCSPEFGADWFELAGKLEEFLRKDLQASQKESEK